MRSRELVLSALATHGRALKWAPADLRADREVVLEAVARWGRSLEFASATLKQDREVVLAAVRADGAAIVYAAAPLAQDLEIQLEAVKSNPFAYLQLHLIMGRPPAPLEYLKANGLLLHFVDASQQDEKSLVHAAVSQNGAALEYCSPRLQQDGDILRAAVRSNPASLFLCSVENARRLGLTQLVCEAQFSCDLCTLSTIPHADQVRHGHHQTRHTHPARSHRRSKRRRAHPITASGADSGYHAGHGRAKCAELHTSMCSCRPAPPCSWGWTKPWAGLCIKWHETFGPTHRSPGPRSTSPIWACAPFSEVFVCARSGFPAMVPTQTLTYPDYIPLYIRCLRIQLFTYTTYIRAGRCRNLNSNVLPRKLCLTLPIA